MHFDEVVRYLLVGSYPNELPYNFPLLPWLAVYVAASVLGQWIGEQLARGQRAKVERSLSAWGAAAVTVVVLYKLWHWTVAMPVLAAAHGAGLAMEEAAAIPGLSPLLRRVGV